MLAQRWGLLRKHPSIISWAHTKILFKHFPNPAIIYNRINLVGKICKNGHARKKKSVVYFRNSGILGLVLLIQLSLNFSLSDDHLQLVNNCCSVHVTSRCTFQSGTYIQISLCAMLLDNCETVMQQLIQSLTETMSELINGNGKSFKMLLFEAKI